MAYISEDVIREIRQQADIVDIISSYLPVEQKGRNYVALCPFHDDHSPSLIISPEKQIFNCFTCRTGGNVFSFVMKYQNVTFVEALKIIADKCGYDLKISADYSSKSEIFKEDYEIMALANKYFMNNINTDIAREAREYLAQRGITEEIIKEFKIGYSLDEASNLHQVLTKKGYSLEKQGELGLVNKYGLDVFDTFRNRIMIPITNLDGQVIAFTGRIFHGEDLAKYLNTKETRIFKKSHILFNYHNALPFIRQEKKVIVVEGNMDAIKVSAHGLKNVVALMGVALSSEQIHILKKLSCQVILSLDNDDAGFDATLKLGQMLNDALIDVAVVRLTGAKDPDEYIEKYGVKAYLDNVNHASKYLDFKINYLKSSKDLKKIDDLVAFVKEVISSFQNADDLTKELIISKISKDYQIDADILKKELAKDNKPKEKNVPLAPMKKNRYDVLASKILYGMMDNPDWIDIYKNKLGYFERKIERIIASEIVYYNNEYGGINVADFTSYALNNEEIKDKVSKIINEESNSNITKEEFVLYIDAMLKELKKMEIGKLKENIKKEMDINKKVMMLEKLTELKKEV